MRRYAVARPITTLCVVAIGLTLPLQTGLLLAGLDVFPGKLAELVFLTGTAAVITSWSGGRGAVRRLFGGLTRWRIGAGRWAMVLLAMPVLTIGGRRGDRHPAQARPRLVRRGLDLPRTAGADRCSPRACGRRRPGPASSSCA